MNTLEEIERIIRRYQELPADFSDVDRLQTASRKLATWLFTLAGEVGMLYKEKNRTEFQRRAAFDRKRKEVISQGESAAKAEAEAKDAVTELLKAEMEADADHRAAQLLYDAAKDVLDALRQHVSKAKEERKFEMTGGMPDARHS